MAPALYRCRWQTLFAMMDVARQQRRMNAFPVSLANVTLHLPQTIMTPIARAIGPKLLFFRSLFNSINTDDKAKMKFLRLFDAFSIYFQSFVKEFAARSFETYFKLSLWFRRPT